MAFCFLENSYLLKNKMKNGQKVTLKMAGIIIKHYYASGAQKETEIYVQNRQKDALMYGQCSPLCVDCLLH